MATIQTKLTSDNKQHDEAFKKSRQEVYNYQKKVDGAKSSILNFASKGLGKLIPSLGLATTAMGALSSAVKLNQQYSDAWGRTMEQAKASYQHLITSISTADFSNLVRGFKDVRAAAKEAYNAMDAVATQKILSKGKLAEYNAKLTEARYKYRKGTGSASDVEYWESMIEEETNKMLPLLIDERNKKINKYIGWNTARSGAIPYGYEGVIEWANKGEEAIQKELKELHRQQDNTNRMTQGYMWQQLENKIRVLSAIYSKLTDGEYLDDVMSSEESYWNYKNSIYQTKLSNTRYTNTKGSSSTPKAKPVYTNYPDKDLFEKMQRLYKQYESMSKITTAAVYDVETEIINVIELTDRWDTSLENVIETANRISPAFTDQLREASNVIGSFANAFSTLGDAADNNFLKGVGILGQAVSTMLLSYAEASAQAAKMGPIAWGIFTATGLAQVATVISQMKSLGQYANGGIVGGNSYTGDRVLARVNSGEMILNGSQQAQLFNMINDGGLGGNVVFKISGSDLVGTLNNYNNKTRRVR